MKDYKILMNRETYKKTESYLRGLKAGKLAGTYLGEKLKERGDSPITVVELIELLIQTKHHKIFAESAVYGDGTDWNQDELAILGDIGIATPVTVYDNGRHRGPEVHPVPLRATLLFTPGALLRNDTNNLPADWQGVTSNGEINPKGYARLYERRLLPPILYANQTSKSRGKMAFITVPGLGCGQFAGKFRGRLGSELQKALRAFLEKYASDLTNVRAVYFDPYRECENERLEIDGVCFFVRPLTKGNENKPQLCSPKDYEEEGDDFDDCELHSLVAWDHVSWPGNDFYAGSRTTDDGVKAAATSAMAVMTGVEGQYDAQVNKYNPPPGYTNWSEVVLKNKIQIEVKDNLILFPSPGD